MIDTLDALYFPNLSLPSLAWTNPVLLYFDSLGIIAPSSYEPSLSRPRTARLVEAGLVRPMCAGVFSDHQEEDALFVERIARRERRRGRPSAGTVKLTGIHAGKLANAGLVEALLQESLLWRDPRDERWLIGSERICLEIMTVLAQRIVRAGDAGAIITNETPAFRIASDRRGTWNLGNSRRIEAVTRLLPVAPWASPDQLVDFKSRHGGELRRFRGFVEQLVRRDEEDVDFYGRVSEAERLRDHLSGELAVIDARAEAPGLALAIAKFVAPLLEASFLSAAVNGLTAMQSRSADTQRRGEIEREELVYAVKASRTLRATGSSQILA